MTADVLVFRFKQQTSSVFTWLFISRVVSGVHVPFNSFSKVILFSIFLSQIIFYMKQNLFYDPDFTLGHFIIYNYFCSNLQGHLLAKE